MIYGHLERHLEESAPSKTVGVLAFILTETSREYLQKIARSVGYSGVEAHAMPSDSAFVSSADPYSIRTLDEDDGPSPVVDPDLLRHPAFFSPELIKMLSAAQKSLGLLMKAQPDHPILNNTQKRRNVQWVWAQRDLDKLGNNNGLSTPEEKVARPQPSETLTTDLGSQFKVFNLDPGSQLNHSLFDQKITSSPESSLHAFLNNFPGTLPPITPTLEHLSLLIFQDLYEHSARLSGALLALLLTPSRTLHIRANLELLR